MKVGDFVLVDRYKSGDIWVGSYKAQVQETDDRGRVLVKSYNGKRRVWKRPDHVALVRAVAV